MLATNDGIPRRRLGIFPPLYDPTHGYTPLRSPRAVRIGKTQFIQSLLKRLVRQIPQGQQCQIEKPSCGGNKSLLERAGRRPIVYTIDQQPTTSAAQVARETLDLGILCVCFLGIGIDDQTTLVGNREKRTGCRSLACIDDNPLTARGELELFGAPIFFHRVPGGFYLAIVLNRQGLAVVARADGGQATRPGPPCFAQGAFPHGYILPCRFARRTFPGTSQVTTLRHFDQSHIPSVTIELQGHLPRDRRASCTRLGGHNYQQAAPSFADFILGGPLKNQSAKGLCLVYHNVHFHWEHFACLFGRSEVRALDQRGYRLESQQGGYQAFGIGGHDVIRHTLSAGQIADRQPNLSQDG